MYDRGRLLKKNYFGFTICLLDQILTNTFKFVVKLSLEILKKSLNFYFKVRLTKLQKQAGNEKKYVLPKFFKY